MTLVADGGGVVAAAVRPIHGIETDAAEKLRALAESRGIDLTSP